MKLLEQIIICDFLRFRRLNFLGLELHGEILFNPQLDR